MTLVPEADAASNLRQRTSSLIKTSGNRISCSIVLPVHKTNNSRENILGGKVVGLQFNLKFPTTFPFAGHSYCGFCQAGQFKVGL